MFINRLINQGNAPLVERMLSFTQARHKLIAQNIANASTPNYVQQDLDPAAFQAKLRRRIEERRSSPPGQVRFGDVKGELTDPNKGVLFHDRSNRSMEQLMSDLSGNAIRHNMFVELMRKQYDSLQNAIKERVA